MGACICGLFLYFKNSVLEVFLFRLSELQLQVPSESEKVVVEQLFQRDAIVRQSQVTNALTNKR